MGGMAVALDTGGRTRRQSLDRALDAARPLELVTGKWLASRCSRWSC
jgi:hypothetical protein